MPFHPIKRFVNYCLRHKLRHRGMYFVNGGDRAGGFVIWIKEFDYYNAGAFLFVPNPMSAIFIRKDEFLVDLKDGNYEFAEIVDAAAYKVCAGNWKYHADKAGLKYKKS